MARGLLSPTASRHVREGLLCFPARKERRGTPTGGDSGENRKDNSSAGSGLEEKKGKLGLTERRGPARLRVSAFSKLKMQKEKNK